MLASIPVNELAETLRVLAGGNAGVAARHFSKHSYDSGDASSAVFWSSIAEVLACSAALASAAKPMHAASAPLAHIREGMAFQGVWYEDVDPEVLAREEPPPIAVPAADEWASRWDKRHGFAPAEGTSTFGRSGRRQLIRPDIELIQAA